MFQSRWLSWRDLAGYGWIVLLVAVGLGVLAAWNVGLPMRAWTRIGGTLGPVLLLAVWAVGSGPRWSPLRHLVQLVATVVLATLGYLYTPTAQGLHFQEAHRRVVQLETVAAGDPAFCEHLARCQDVIEAFPELARRVHLAVQQWMRQTRDNLATASPVGGVLDPKAIAQTALQLRDLRSPKSAEQWYRDVDDLLAAALAARLQAAREESVAHQKAGRTAEIEQLIADLLEDWWPWVSATGKADLNRFRNTWRANLSAMETRQIEQALQEGNLERARQQIEAVVRRGDPARSRAVVVELRRKLLRARLATARATLHALLRDDRDRYDEVADLSKQLATVTRADLDQVGTQADREAFATFHDTCAALVQAARTAGKAKP